VDLPAPRLQCAVHLRGIEALLRMPYLRDLLVFTDTCGSAVTWSASRRSMRR
jgi:hypothetical protein